MSYDIKALIGFIIGGLVANLAICGYYIYQWWLLRQEDKDDDENEGFY